MLLIFGISVGLANAQTCPDAASVTLSATSTPNTCSGNGTITATFSPTGNITVQLLKSGSIQKTAVNVASPYIFDILQAGTDYQVRLVCSNDNNVILKPFHVTVAENYIPISSANITSSNLCTNFTAGGTITVNSVTGGTAPYQYSFVKKDNANYPDSESVYSATNNISVTEYGNINYLLN